MFPRSYFTGSYFASSYFPPVISEEAIPAVEVGRLSAGAVVYSVEDPRVKYVKYLRGYFSAVKETPLYARIAKKSLEQDVEEIGNQTSPEQLEALSKSIQGLAELLIQQGARLKPFEPIPLILPPPVIETIGDLVIERKRQEDDEEDEILLMMLLQ
ncbi:hypothetical protein UFOVP313_45 [uncultured Caudovirales phage]|uniref:Uncharacterized protein n=1 Tax=uncultured Caudovirales phage TaxID=2100421 RepID=A0A6J5LVN9_9CAUD|nr:hypothetical protein UFOVP313_45 [uncultured Caudovirales phage]